MEKRGQLTIFIILGIVILVIIGVLFYVIYSPRALQTSPEEFSDVQKYVDACVESTLDDAVRFCGGDRCKDYENNIADYITANLQLCTNFAVDFPTTEIIPKGTISATVTLNADKTLINAVVLYPITVKKGGQTKILERFYAEISFVTKACIPILVDSNCIALEDKTFTMEADGIKTTWEIKQGDDLRIYGSAGVCPAC
jgi:hypothetical protein